MSETVIVNQTQKPLNRFPDEAFSSLWPKSPKLLYSKAFSDFEQYSTIGLLSQQR